MSDLLKEELLTVAEAAKRLPHGKNGRPIHVATVHRWIQRGVRGVRLESCRVGGRRLTSFEALSRFAAAVTAAADGFIPAASASASHQHELDLVEQQLDDAGL